MKTLSIIIPLYNKEKDFEYPNLIETKCSEMKISYEILIIENESTDNSFDIANNYVKNKDNISLFRSNKGLENALKEGEAIAKNDYVAFIPADFTFGKSELEYFSRENSQLSEYIIGSRALEGSFSESSFDRENNNSWVQFIEKNNFKSEYKR